MSKQLGLASLAAIAILALSAQANGATIDEIIYASEVKSCVAEIRDHVNYGDAERVRHDVVLVKRKLLGYAMKIDTSIYTESAAEATREYATYCVVNGDHKPLKFEISQTGNGA